MQLAEIFLCHPVTPVMVGSGVVTGEHGERCISVVPQLAPLLSPPRHRFEHEDVEIGINTLPGHKMDVHAPLKVAVPCSGPMDNEHGKNSSTDRSGDLSTCTPHTRSRRSQYLGSLKWSDCAALGDTAIATSGGISVMTH
jgi:hypothetical protein